MPAAQAQVSSASRPPQAVAMDRIRSTAIACTGGSMIPLVAGNDEASSLCSEHSHWAGPGQ